MMEEQRHRPLGKEQGKTAAVTCSLVIAAVLSGFINTVTWRSRAQTAEAEFLSFVVHMQDAQYERARHDIESALAISPDNAYYRSNQGLVYERSLRWGPGPGKYTFQPPDDLDPAASDSISGAVDAYSAAIRCNPNDACWAHNLGWLYWLSGRRDLALDWLHRAAVIDPATPIYHLSLGMFYEQTRAFEEATCEYERGLRMSPAILGSQFYHDLEERLPIMARSIKAKAIADLEGRLVQAGDAITESQLGRLYLGDDDARAHELLVAATTTLPSLSRAWLNLGVSWNQRGDQAKAELCFRRAAFLGQGDYLAVSRLGGLCEARNDSKSAIEWYRKALDSWDQMISEHAIRSLRVYNTSYVVRDDLIPRGLMRYTEPALDRAAICAKLSSLYAQAGDRQLAAYFQAQSESEAP